MEIAAVQELLNKLEETDITHDELGEANGFHTAQFSLQNAREYFQKILDVVVEYGDKIQSGYLAQHLKQIHDIAARIINLAVETEDIVKSGTNQNDYPNRRNSIHKQMESVLTDAQQSLYPFDVALRLCRLESRLADDRMVENAERQHKQIANIFSESKNILETLRDDTAKHAVAKAAENFSALATAHRTNENVWFNAFVAASLTTVAAVIWAVYSYDTYTNLPAAIGAIVKRALVISAPAVFMRVCLSKFNLERNLRIIYNHRDTVLEQFKVFDGAIGNDDIEAKNQFRLEIARLIFQDPDTGYTKANAGSEININPVLSTVEKVAKNVK